jgi:hypothetical protein
VATFIGFWNPLVSAWNPSQNEAKAAVHRSARDTSELNYTLRGCTAPESCSPPYYPYTFVLSTTTKRSGKECSVQVVWR